MLGFSEGGRLRNRRSKIGDMDRVKILVVMVLFFVCGASNRASAPEIVPAQVAPAGRHGNLLEMF